MLQFQLHRSFYYLNKFITRYLLLELQHSVFNWWVHRVMLFNSIIRIANQWCTEWVGNIEEEIMPVILNFLAVRKILDNFHRRFKCGKILRCDKAWRTSLEIAPYDDLSHHATSVDRNDRLLLQHHPFGILILQLLVVGNHRELVPDTPPQPYREV